MRYKIFKKKSKITNLTNGKNCKILEPVNIYGSKFGDNIFVGPFVEIQKKTIIGNNTKISSHSFICSLVEIGKNCFIGHCVSFVNDKFLTNNDIRLLFKNNFSENHLIVFGANTVKEKKNTKNLQSVEPLWQEAITPRQ